MYQVVAADVTSVPNREDGAIDINGMVEEISYRKVSDNSVHTRRMDGVFIFVGLEPNTTYFKSLVDVDNSGHIITDSSMKTSHKGIFAVGDIRAYSASQLASSSGDGVTAAVSAHRYIKNGIWENNG